MAQPTFDPPLRTTRALHLHSHGLQLHFTALVPRTAHGARDEETADGALQLWTNLPLAGSRPDPLTGAADEVDQNGGSGSSSGWHAHDLLSLPSSSSSSSAKQQQLLSCTVRVPSTLPADQNQGAAFRYTYRKIWPDGRVEWYGSEADDGLVRLVVASPPSPDSSSSHAAHSPSWCTYSQCASLTEVQQRHEAAAAGIHVRRVALPVRLDAERGQGDEVLLTAREDLSGIVLERTK